MSIKIVSTTDTPEAVIAAKGGLVSEKNVESSEQSEDTKAATTDETSDVETQPEESAPEETEAKGDETEEDDESTEGDKEDRPKKNRGYKRKIDKLNVKLSAQEQEIQFLKEQLMRNGRTDANVEQKSFSQNHDQKPIASNYETHEEYVEAVSDWKVRQLLKENEQKQKESELKQEYQKQVSTYETRVEEFVQTHEDFYEAIDGVSDVRLPIAVQEAILTSDVGPAIAYELAKNRKEFVRICSLTSTQAAREIGKIEARLEKASEPKEEKKIFKKPTQAPTPIKPLGAKSTANSSEFSEDMDFQAYKKWRAKHS
jgi:hypothetical protein